MRYHSTSTHYSQADSSVLLPRMVTARVHVVRLQMVFDDQIETGLTFT